MRECDKIQTGHWSLVFPLRNVASMFDLVVRADNQAQLVGKHPSFLGQQKLVTLHSPQPFEAVPKAAALSLSDAVVALQRLDPCCQAGQQGPICEHVSQSAGLSNSVICVKSSLQREHCSAKAR